MAPDYRGRTALDADRLGVVDESALIERLIGTFESPDYQPPRLPSVALELVALSSKADVSFEEIEALLEQDAMLAGEVLRLARSSYYTRTRPAQSMHQAVVRLGLKQIRDVVLQAAMNVRVFRSKAYRGCMERIRTHSRAMAHLARVVSRYTPIDEEQAFLCGLLHDIGFAGSLLVLGEVGRGGTPPALDLGVGLVPVDPGADAELQGLVRHGHVDHSDPPVLARAERALDLNESTLELIRADAAEWLRADTR